MKKFCALLLATCLVFTLAACGGAAASSGAPASTAAPASTPAAVASVSEFQTESTTAYDPSSLPPMKIAFFYGSWETVLGAQFMRAFEYLGENFNFEPVFGTGGGASPEESVAAVETMLAAGDIDGIVSVTWDTARMDVANKYGVPVVLACQFAAQQEVAAIAAYDTFLGGVVDDEVWAGYNAMKGLYDAGCRNVALSGLTPGLAQGHDERAQGALQFVEEHSDMNLLTESYTQGLFHEDVPTFAASFPEMDGIWFSAVGNSVYNAMTTEGIDDGSVKIAGPDVDSMAGEQFEKGVQVWSCAGQYATIMVGWAILYNYLLDGTQIIADTTVPLTRNYLEINSYENFQAYEEVVNSPVPAYNADEMAQLLHQVNPDISFDDFVALGQSYSLEDIAARRA